MNKLLLGLVLLPPLGSNAQDAKFAPVAQGTLLVNPSYIVDFDEESRIAHWVHYELTSHEVSGSASRSNQFRRDGRASNSAHPQNYKSSGYDRGHLKPAGDSKSSAREMANSFWMTNVFPQTPSLNRGLWRTLEQGVRGWASSYSSVHVSTGASLQTQGHRANQVRVPTYCWKAILRTAPDTAVIAFWMPNAAGVEGNPSDYIVSVDLLESRIGIDLFPKLPDSTERRLESIAVPWSMAKGKRSSNSGTGVSASHQCTGRARSTGKRCRNMTTHPSGTCHHHRD